jgi:hypothetical protein
MDSIQLLPGFVQGIVRVIISYPFDYVRTNIQAKKSFKNIPIRDVYKGLSVPLLTVPFDRAIQFYLFESLKSKYSNLQSSLITSSITSVYSVPINFLQTRIMLKSSKEVSYRGYSADFLRGLLSTSIYLSSYGYLREHSPYKHPFLLGILSSSALWTVVYPLDTLRVLKQSSTLSYKEIIQTTSLKAFYAGYPLVLLRSFPSSGFGMMAYEYTKSMIANHSK